MNDLYKNIEKLCKDNNLTIGKMCSLVGISRGNMTDLKNDRKNSMSSKNLQKIADYFGVSLDHIIGRRNYPSNMEVFDRETGKLVATYKDGKKVNAPTLTAKDERDIEKSLVQTLSALEEGQAGLMFDGEPLDEITRELLAASLRNSMEMAKKLAKEKYGRKKED